MPKTIPCYDCKGKGTYTTTGIVVTNPCKTCKGGGVLSVYTQEELNKAVKAEREAILNILLKQIRHCMWHVRKQAQYLYGSELFWQANLSLYRSIYTAIRARNK